MGDWYPECTISKAELTGFPEQTLTFTDTDDYVVFRNGEYLLLVPSAELDPGIPEVEE